METCPGDTVKYSCHVSPNAVNSITWYLSCQEQVVTDTITVGVNYINRSEQYSCFNGGMNDAVTFDVNIIFTQNENEAYSNITIEMLTNFTTDLIIDCEDPTDSEYRNLSFTGSYLLFWHINYILLFQAYPLLLPA